MRINIMEIFLFKIKDNNLLIINIIEYRKVFRRCLQLWNTYYTPLEAFTKAQAVIARTYAYFKWNQINLILI